MIKNPFKVMLLEDRCGHPNSRFCVVECIVVTNRLTSAVGYGVEGVAGP